MLRKIVSSAQSNVFKAFLNRAKVNKEVFVVPSAAQKVRFFSQNNLQFNEKKTEEDKKKQQQQEEDDEEQNVKRMKDDGSSEDSKDQQKSEEDKAGGEKSQGNSLFAKIFSVTLGFAAAGGMYYLFQNVWKTNKLPTTGMFSWFGSFSKPSSEKLLPDLEGPDASRKPTLVISLDDCLVHMTYTPQTGWKVKKRPGVDKFLEEMSKYYEIVIFSDQNMMTAMPIVERLDPMGLTSKLFRDAMHYSDGKLVKDLAHLNRPLNRVIMLEHRADAYSLQPANTFPLKPWYGNPQDQTLIQLMPVLSSMAQNVGPLADVREYMKLNFGNLSVEQYLLKANDQKFFAAHRGGQKQQQKQNNEDEDDPLIRIRDKLPNEPTRDINFLKQYYLGVAEGVQLTPEQEQEVLQLQKRLEDEEKERIERSEYLSKMMWGKNKK